MFGSRKSISGKENVFMCLVVFQKIFRKIFSGVWKMLQGKRQNQKNKHSTQIDARDRLGSTARCFASSSPTTAPLIAISRSTAPLREIAIDASRECDRREGKILTGCNSTNLSCIFDLKLIILTRYTSSLAIRVLSISPTFSFSF